MGPSMFGDAGDKHGNGVPRRGRVPCLVTQALSTERPMRDLVGIRVGQLRIRVRPFGHNSTNVDILKA